MARLRKSETIQPGDSRAGSHDSLYRRPSTPPSQQKTTRTRPGSSDKENTPVQGEQRTRHNASMPSRDSILTEDSSRRSPKRRRLSERDEHINTAPKEKSKSQHESEMHCYDPDQDPEERRQVREAMRSHQRELQENANEYLRPDDRFLKQLQRADKDYRQVKQTSDATIDSTFLVGAGDLMYKRSRQAAIGSSLGTGIDVEEFIGKCLQFMRNGDEEDPSAATRRRKAQDEDEDRDEEEDGDAFNWQWLGSRACLPFIRRPPTTSFLLGPLSVQKRARKVTARQEREKREKPAEAKEAQRLQTSEMSRNEASSVVIQCSKVHSNFRESMDNKQERARVLWEETGCDGLNEDEYNETISAIQEEVGLCGDDGEAMPLIQFAFNPYSFGQTVENLFYISFLIREDKLKMEYDSNNIPLLYDTGDDVDEREKAKQGRDRHQAICSLGWNEWLELINVFDVKEPMIPHRNESGARTQVGASGWYT